MRLVILSFCTESTAAVPAHGHGVQRAKFEARVHLLRRDAVKHLSC